MENFIAYNPTRVHFGKGVVHDLGSAAEESGKRVLVVYGKGSVFKNGSYDQVMEQLNTIGAEVYEYSGIKPNPVVDDVDRASKIGFEKNIDLIVAIGGGSVIDSAKIISVCIAQNCTGWEVMKGNIRPDSAIPLIAVLTLAATGSEMNHVAVLQNMETREKIGYRNEVMFPNHSFLDPQYTASVPYQYTAYGIADVIAHCLENFFGSGDASLSDRFIEAIIRETMEYGPRLLKDPGNYDLRAKIMWAATNALNGLTAFGRGNGDWGVHALGHILSLLYDTPHGATLSVAYPAWLKFQEDRIPERIGKLGQMLFQTKSTKETINKIEALFVSLDCPVTLTDAGIDQSKKDEIVNLMNRNKSNGLVHMLDNQARRKIVNLMDE